MLLNDYIRLKISLTALYWKAILQTLEDYYK